MVNIEKISSRIIMLTLDGNPQTNVPYCYIPTSTLRAQYSEIWPFSIVDIYHFQMFLIDLSLKK